MLLTVYTIEIAYTLYNISSYKHKKWSKNKLTRYDVYMDYKNSAKEAVVIVPPVSYISKQKLPNNLYPLSGISKKFTISCNELGFWSTYKSDRYGFNNPDAEWDKLSFDFLLVGDSFTHGSCVHQKNSIAGQLRNNANVINLGYAGNGPLIEYASLKEYFKDIDAKNVLWFYYENDLKELKSELSNKTLIKYLDDINFTQNLINNQKEINQIASKTLNEKLKKYQEKDAVFFRFEEFYFKRVLLLFTIRHRLSWMFKKDFLNINLISEKEKKLGYFDEYLDEFENILKLTKNLTMNNNSKLYFVYLPEYPGVFDNNRLQTYKKIIKTTKKLDISIIDLYEVFSNHPDPKSLFPSRSYGHYNNDGYKLVVETILNNLE